MTKSNISTGLDVQRKALTASELIYGTLKE
jgi:hypothetical protein